MNALQVMILINKQLGFIPTFNIVSIGLSLPLKGWMTTELIQMISELNTEPEFITEAYDLKAELACVLDYIDDILNSSIEKLKAKPVILPEIAQKLSEKT